MAETAERPPILVVDDDRDYGALVRRALERADDAFAVEHVRDGVACLDALDRRTFAAVVLDYRLPQMNGLDVLREIRARGCTTPVVIATGQGDERVAVDAMKAGAADYLVKTAGYFATLPTVLDKVLRQDRLALENRRLVHEAARQQARLGEIFEATSDGIALVDATGFVRFANRRVGELLGLDTGTPTGLTLATLLDGSREGADVAASLLAPPLDERSGDLEVPPTGRTLHWVARPILEGDGVTSLALTFHDVTRERDIGRMKSDFVSFVAHQLRTPLSGIKWMLELAGGEVDHDTVVSCVNDAATSADRLIAIVNDLLDISRLESGVLAVEQTAVDLGAVTESLLTEVSGLVRDKAHRLSVDVTPDTPPAAADPKLIRQALGNLLSNAVKYTPAGGAVSVRVARDEDTVHWIVQDSGIGIPLAAQDRLFEKFFRADNVRAIETEGTGLGLYLARLIVERHGGRIWWASQEGRGATFGVAIPVAVEGT